MTKHDRLEGRCEARSTDTAHHSHELDMSRQPPLAQMSQVTSKRTILRVLQSQISHPSLSDTVHARNNNSGCM